MNPFGKRARGTPTRFMDAMKEETREVDVTKEGAAQTSLELIDPFWQRLMGEAESRRRSIARRSKYARVMMGN